MEPHTLRRRHQAVCLGEKACGSKASAGLPAQEGPAAAHAQRPAGTPCFFSEYIPAAMRHAKCTYMVPSAASSQKFRLYMHREEGLTTLGPNP